VVNFWPFQPFYLRRSAMFLIWCAAEICTIKEEFTQAILSLIYVYFGYLLVVGLNKIPCLLFLWTIINIHDVYDLKGIYYLVLFLAFLSVSRTVKTNCTVFDVNQPKIGITNFDENVTRTLTENNIEFYWKKTNSY
jgi:hypothetical protein